MGYKGGWRPNRPREWSLSSVRLPEGAHDRVVVLALSFVLSREPDTVEKPSRDVRISSLRVGPLKRGLLKTGTDLCKNHGMTNLSHDDRRSLIFGTHDDLSDVTCPVGGRLGFYLTVIPVPTLYDRISMSTRKILIKNYILYQVDLLPFSQQVNSLCTRSMRGSETLCRDLFCLL